MPFQRGTATDYRDLLDKLDKFITNRSVSAVAINADGLGYAVGDLLSIDGGTVEGSMTGRIEVTTIGGSGEITAARIYDAGAYSTDPTLTANSVTGGSGTGATFDLTLANTGWTNRIKNVSPASGPITVQAGEIGSDGSGYTAGDVVTLAGTPIGDTIATFTIDTVNPSGEVQNISLTNAGSYTTHSSADQPTTGGTGTGLTIEASYIPTRDGGSNGGGQS